MSETDRDKWNARYGAGAYRSRRHPTALLAEWLPDLPRGRALDLGCGAGRNALALAAAGFEVDAVDVSPVALERARAETAPGAARVRWIEADLEDGAGTESVIRDDYAVILMVRYVNIPIMRRMTERLMDGGCLLSEQHIKTRREVAGPRNPAYRLDANQLLGAVAGLRVLYYREAIVEDPDGRQAALAQVIACRGTPCFEHAAHGSR